MYDDIAAVVKNEPLTGGHFVLHLDCPRQARAARPGQFAMVRLLGHTDVLLRRPMSIYDVQPAAGGTAAPGEPAVMQLLYKIVGQGTRLMAELKPGDQVGLLGPLGHGFFAEEYLPLAEQTGEVLLVAGGIGIAALLLPAREIAKAGLSQQLFFGGRTREDLVGVAEFESSVQQVTLATENGSEGHRGYVTEPLGRYLESRRESQSLLLACGPWAMLRATVALAQKYSQPCLVSMENRMGCGIGVCLGCSIRVEGTGHAAYQRVCTEGPVFAADKVIWEGNNISEF